MKRIFLLLFILISVCSCGQSKAKQKDEAFNLEKTITIIVEGNTIETRFKPPAGFTRTKVDSTSFTQYLRSLPLKAKGSKVTYFDGRKKANFGVYDAVIDLPIGKRDLHQCADAVMRLRADYLFERKRYSDIHFNFTNGFKADYSNWKNGKRIIVQGNKVFWKQRTSPSNSQKNYWKYLEMIFSYAGTASLSKELKPIALKDIEAGDVFIKGGFPGHAVIVVDIAVNATSGKKMFLLAQSYMPAQELQILKNPNSSKDSPWYSSDFSGNLITPEWVFKKNELKRF